jgi:hypothetical protein
VVHRKNYIAHSANPFLTEDIKLRDGALGLVDAFRVRVNRKKIVLVCHTV